MHSRGKGQGSEKLPPPLPSKIAQPKHYIHYMYMLNAPPKQVVIVSGTYSNYTTDSFLHEALVANDMIVELLVPHFHSNHRA